jgi:hypothetical protein
MQLRARWITVMIICALLMLSPGTLANASPSSEAGSEEPSSSTLEPSITEEDEPAERLVEPDEETAPSQTTTTMASETPAESTTTAAPAAPVPALRPTPPSPAPLATGPATIDISPTSGPPGTPITVSGTNWTHETWASGVPIHVYQNYGNGNLKRLAEGHSGPPGSDGKFRLRMIIPPPLRQG